MKRASIGKNSSCPVAFAADSKPKTTPRRASNQRLVTTTANTIAVIPVPAPTQTPQSKVNCHCVFICVVRATDAVNKASAQSTRRRTPQRFINEAAKGPIRPNKAMLIAIAAEIAAVDQPNSCSSGTIKTPGVARTAAVTSSTQKVTAAMTQA